MFIANKTIILKKFNELLEEQSDLNKLIENKNIFFKKYINHYYLSLKQLPKEVKKEAGIEINSLNNEIMHLFEEKKKKLESLNDLKQNKVDYSLDLNTFKLDKGSKTILSLITDQIIDFFKQLNFEIIEGDEVTTIENNMDRLNIDINHPARDPKDTFYIDSLRLLRTHCTATTAEIIHNNDKEIKVLSYGNVYRNDDDDLTHSHQFTQIDIVWIKNNLSINHLKSLIDNMLKSIFGQKIKTRYRLSYFPFTEPSFEVDINCLKCKGKGCNFCKQTGWIEILGAGILNKNVLKFANIKKINGGVAAGIGIERIAMLKYGIKDIRDIYNNDFRLINQLRGRE